MKKWECIAKTYFLLTYFPKSINSLIGFWPTTISNEVAIDMILHKKLTWLTWFLHAIWTNDSAVWLLHFSENARKNHVPTVIQDKFILYHQNRIRYFKFNIFLCRQNGTILIFKIDQWSHIEMSFMRSVPNDYNHLFTVCNQIRQKFITLQKSIHRRQNFLHQVKQNKFFQTTDS